MTWDQLLWKIRDGLRESSGHVRHLDELIAKVATGDHVFTKGDTAVALVLLAAEVSEIHSVVEHLGIGLDAVVETLREANKSQEVKRE